MKLMLKQIKIYRDIEINLKRTRECSCSYAVLHDLRSEKFQFLLIHEQDFEIWDELIGNEFTELGVLFMSNSHYLSFFKVASNKLSNYTQAAVDHFPESNLPDKASCNH